jgi:enoyl-CoA hydratase/carnithine racemase
MSEVSVERHGHVALIEFSRPPHNYFTVGLIRELADTVDTLGADAEIRAIVLAAAGKTFCAGQEFTTSQIDVDEEQQPELYVEGIRLYRSPKPIIVAVQGGAIGGGLGIPMVGDFRIAAPEAWFTANFVRIGLSAGFALTYRLPRLIGQQKAAKLFYTGRKIGAEEALAIGLVDRLVPTEQLREAAIAFANEIAVNAPLAVQSTRATLRLGEADAIEAQLRREYLEQRRLIRTADFAEGVAALRERRPGNWTGA